MADEKKVGFFKSFASKISRFFKDLKGEMKKIVWPSKKQIINNTWVVIVVVVIASIVVGGFDYLLNLLVGLFAQG
ncbi:MAG: preprotein translocase subunit SecE [Negativibacillus sp.]